MLFIHIKSIFPRNNQTLQYIEIIYSLYNKTAKFEFVTNHLFTPNFDGSDESRALAEDQFKLIFYCFILCFTLRSYYSGYFFSSHEGARRRRIKMIKYVVSSRRYLTATLILYQKLALNE